MAFHLALTTKTLLEQETDACSKLLNALAAGHKNAVGLVPDHIRLSPSYRDAKAAYDAAFKAQRAFNQQFMKRYKKEYAAHVKARRAA